MYTVVHYPTKKIISKHERLVDARQEVLDMQNVDSMEYAIFDDLFRNYTWPKLNETFNLMRKF